jgi:phosphatidate phosphatase APP1
MPVGDPRQFNGKTQLLARRGLSIISDIDDTIKISHVLDKHELLANTFLREFRPVAGMARAYQKWASAGAAFHYLSSSPWQLYPSLLEFMEQQDFPAGSFHLNTFRAKDKSFFNLFQSAQVTKPPRIEAILNRHPQRSFILVGDSGEKDPEIYGTIARRYPKQIKHIFIRNVQPGREQRTRFSQAFTTLPLNRWTLFGEADEIVFRND